MLTPLQQKLSKLTAMELANHSAFLEATLDHTREVHAIMLEDQREEVESILAEGVMKGSHGGAAVETGELPFLLWLRTRVEQAIVQMFALNKSPEDTEAQAVAEALGQTTEDYAMRLHRRQILDEERDLEELFASLAEDELRDAQEEQRKWEKEQRIEDRLEETARTTHLDSREADEPEYDVLFRRSSYSDFPYSVSNRTQSSIALEELLVTHKEIMSVGTPVWRMPRDSLRSKPIKTHAMLFYDSQGAFYEVRWVSRRHNAIYFPLLHNTTLCYGEHALSHPMFSKRKRDAISKLPEAAFTIGLQNHRDVLALICLNEADFDSWTFVLSQILCTTASTAGATSSLISSRSGQNPQAGHAHAAATPTVASATVLTTPTALALSFASSLSPQKHITAFFKRLVKPNGNKNNNNNNDDEDDDDNEDDD